MDKQTAALRKALRRALGMQTGGMHHHITAPPSAAARCSCPACVKDHIRAVLRASAQSEAKRG